MVTARTEAVAGQYAGGAAASAYVAAHEGWGSSARYYHSRFHAVDEALRAIPGGDLLDVGCGPGMLVGHVRATRPGDFAITACDQSPAMIDAVAENTGFAEDVRLSVAAIEKMPFDDGSFDVVLATGVLEYTDAPAALAEVTRVLRPGGLAVVTMLNPLSPYRLVEWCLFWPVRRLLGRIERAFGVPKARRHGAVKSGIQALRPARLAELMRRAGLSPEDLVFYDVTILVPPIDKVSRPRLRRWHTRPETTVSRGALRWLGTAYLIAARRTCPGQGVTG